MLKHLKYCRLWEDCIGIIGLHQFALVSKISLYLKMRLTWGSSAATQQVKPLPSMPTSHMDTDSQLSCSTPDPATCQWPWKSNRKCSKYLDPIPTPDEVPGSWFDPGIALAVTPILRGSMQTKHLSHCLCLSFKYINVSSQNGVDNLFLLRLLSARVFHGDSQQILSLFGGPLSKSWITRQLCVGGDMLILRAEVTNKCCKKQGRVPG